MSNAILPPAVAATERLRRSFHDVVRQRKSCRQFLPEPVAPAIIRSVLDDARYAPSNCNTQPWVTHVVSGDKLQELAAAIKKASDAGHLTPDFSFDTAAFYGRYGERQRAQGQAYYEHLGVAREDDAGRAAVRDFGNRFYGAPHAAFLFMPSFGDHVRVAGDIGMYGQTLLLALTDHGLGSIPQTSLGYFADTVRAVLGVPSELKLLFAISFGYADEAAPANAYQLGRAPLSSTVVFHD
jgi:nitroreductase